MKTAISVPDDLFEQADRFAEQLGWSRSQLYATAVRDYLRRRSHGAIREALDTVYAVHDSSLDEGLAAAQSEVLEEEDW